MNEERTATLTRAEVRSLVRDELDAVRGEAAHGTPSSGRAVARLYAASLLLYLAVAFLTLMVVYVLGALIEPSIGAGIVGGSLLVGSLVFFLRANAARERTARQS